MINAVADTGWLKLQRTRLPASKALPLAMLLYATSLIKFVVRDPLATQTGPQGAIELLLVMAAALVLLPAFCALRYRPFATPLSKLFLLFGVLAAASSAFSYYPLLSFMKAVSFFLVCGIAVTASTAFKPVEVLRYFIYAVISVLVIGLVLKLASQTPLFEIDAYSGRARFTLYAWHPGTLADLCALTLLASFLLPKRIPVYFQILLFALNIATAARSSSALLVLVLLAFGFAAVRITPRVLLLCGCLGFLVALLLWMGLQRQPHDARNSTSVGQSLYGDKLNEDVLTLNGRTEVWEAAESLLAQSLFLGYGFDGARDVLITHTSWGAGHAHNSILELILAGGLPSMFLFLSGWAGSARRFWISGGRVRLRALGLYAYIAVFGITAPNLTYLQYVVVFLIITVDAMLYTSESSR